MYKIDRDVSIKEIICVTVEPILFTLNVFIMLTDWLVKVLLNSISIDIMEAIKIKEVDEIFFLHICLTYYYAHRTLLHTATLF